MYISSIYRLCMGQSESHTDEADAVERNAPRNAIAERLYNNSFAELGSNAQIVVEEYLRSIRQYASKMYRKSLDMEQFTEAQLQRLFELSKLDLEIAKIENRINNRKEHLEHDIYYKEKELERFRRETDRTHLSPWPIDQKITEYRLKEEQKMEESLQELNRKLETLTTKTTKNQTLQKLIKKREGLIEINF